MVWLQKSMKTIPGMPADDSLLALDYLGKQE
jgi:hypothetical protein